MKKIIMAFIIATATSLGTPFFEQDDKQKHIAATMAISAISSNIYYYYGMSFSDSWWAGFATGVFVGFMKEAYDSRDGGTGFDGKDMIANTIGSAIGTNAVWFQMKF